MSTRLDVERGLALTPPWVEARWEGQTGWHNVILSQYPPEGCDGYLLKKLYEAQTDPSNPKLLRKNYQGYKQPADRECVRQVLAWASETPDYVRDFLSANHVESGHFDFYRACLLTLGDTTVRDHPLLIWWLLQHHNKHDVVRIINASTKPLAILRTLLGSDHPHRASKAHLRALQKITSCDHSVTGPCSSISSDAWEPWIPESPNHERQFYGAFAYLHEHLNIRPYVLLRGFNENSLRHFLRSDACMKRVNHLHGTISPRIVRIALTLPSVLSHPLTRQAVNQHDLLTQAILAVTLEILEDLTLLSPHRWSEWPFFDDLEQLKNQMVLLGSRTGRRPWEQQPPWTQNRITLNVPIKPHCSPTINNSPPTIVTFLGLNPEPHRLQKWGFRNCLTNHSHHSLKYRRATDDGSGLLAVFKFNDTLTLGYIEWAKDGQIYLCESDSIDRASSGSFPEELFIGAIELSLSLMNKSSTSLTQGQRLKVHQSHSSPEPTSHHRRGSPVHQSLSSAFDQISATFEIAAV